MHKLIINKLGPIERCELDCTQFMTLTGFQASGKSTIAKAIYYFRTIKNDILEIVKAQALTLMSSVRLNNEENLQHSLEMHLREKFLRTFGSSRGMSNDMYMEYYFTENCYVKISLKENKEYEAPNYIWVTFSQELKSFLEKKNKSLSATTLGIPEDELNSLKTELAQLFEDDCTVVYIPAGRSMITLLSQQLNYIYATMGDMQKRSIDSCTKDYIERILRLKPEFAEGLQGLVSYSIAQAKATSPIIKHALMLISKILRGSYRYSNGEEQIELNDGKYVKLNFSSSGQQESVWILNLLFYYLLQPEKYLFIIEEPESHLFPESQKYITELISLVNHCQHSIVLTTHSPYVLGTLNNLLYAYTLDGKYKARVNEIIPEIYWINGQNFNSWFVKNGVIENCMDSDIGMIQNEKIDEISKVINEDFEKILYLQDDEEEGGVQ